MKIVLNWDSAMKLTASSGNLSTTMDAKPPIGAGSAMTPKELVAAGLAGCTAMDVLALFKKHHQTVDSFEVTVDIEASQGGHPAVFVKADITFIAKGRIDKSIYLEAVRLSQTKYCGVSAMLSKAFPIHYKVILNDEMIGDGQAQF